MRQTVDFNDDWLYLPKDRSTAKLRTGDERGFSEVTLPHSNVELPWHNFDDRDYQFISWYRKHFKIPRAWQGQRLRLRFEGVMLAAEVWLNDELLGEHKGGFTPFEFDITDAVEDSGDNVLAVRVDSTERPDIPPFGARVDYLTFGGIYRDVTLRVLPPVHIRNVFTRPTLDRLDATVAVANRGGTLAETAVTLRLGNRSVQRPLRVLPGETAEVNLSLEDLDVKPWSVDDPNLYTARIVLDEDDETTVRVGFREASFAQDGLFYLNGDPLSLRGLNRHQNFPYVGPAMPARLQRRDADILKNELGCNIVRTSHYPQSPHFLDRCDEIGLLVFEELPGWGHIGDDEWKEVSKRELRDMILRDRNHPSIVLWGVRINESPDEHDFYAQTNAIAHELDPTRQTGGVRNIRESELLEDVFTYNDFSNGVLEPVAMPYLVTEFLGHMFPTKPWDPEERLLEHALRHARIQDAQRGMENVAGAIGWCAFDYNTHAEHGSGDRVCYHGVMDIFRFPKLAAGFYKSQQDPSVRPVVEPATLWKWGERNGGGVEPLIVFTNCDAVEVRVDGEKRGVFKPDRGTYPHLPHPPVRCESVSLQENWGDLEVVGLLGGKAVVRRCIAGDGIPQKLHLVADDLEIDSDGSDCTRIAFGAVDRYGNFLPFATGVVELEVTGPARLIGENPFPLVAGRGALYLRSTGRKGRITVTARMPRLEEESITIQAT
jgi:beta-galactosidase